MIDLAKYQAILDEWLRDAPEERRSQILQLKSDLLEAGREIMALQARLPEGREEAKAAPILEFDGRLLWQDAPGGRQGPFCQRCWEVDARRVHLQRSVDVRDGHGWKCFECGRFYSVPIKDSK